jgi:hypothetical protein
MRALHKNTMIHATIQAQRAIAAWAMGAAQAWQAPS